MADIAASVTVFGGFLLGTIVPFLFVLTVVVFVHEMGHYLVGRWCGIGVRAFSIGFGPELLGFTDRRGTRWMLSVIPLGGYVKFVGDVGASSQPDAESIEKLSDEERRVAFHLQPVWKRAATVFAGPLFNFILSVVVFAVMLAAFGRYVAEPMVAEVRPDSPAAEAGIQPGDRFVSVDGASIETFSDVQRIVSVRAGEPLTIVLSRDGRQVEVVAVPEATEQTDALGNTVRIGIIGVVNNEELGQPRHVEYGPVEAMAAGVEQTGIVIARTGQFLKRLVAGREDRCQIGGPVRIADMAGKAAEMGVSWLFQLIAVLSVGIGILNLLPIPPLDGGHLAFYAAEAVLRRPVPWQVMEVAYRAGMLMVLLFMGFVFWNDLFGC